MGDKAILENDRTLKFVPDCYKTQKMCDKAADNYLHAWEFIRRCYITQKMCDKAVVSYPSAIRLKKCEINLLIYASYIKYISKISKIYIGSDPKCCKTQ